MRRNVAGLMAAALPRRAHHAWVSSSPSSLAPGLLVAATNDGFSAAAERRRGRRVRCVRAPVACVGCACVGYGAHGCMVTVARAKAGPLASVRVHAQGACGHDMTAMSRRGRGHDATAAVAEQGQGKGVVRGASGPGTRAFMRAMAGVRGRSKGTAFRPVPGEVCARRAHVVAVVMSWAQGQAEPGPRRGGGSVARCARGSRQS
jgi:hypothetical protein